MGNPIIQKIIRRVQFTMISCLEKNVCCSTTIGDLFKLIIPVGWTIVVLCAVLAYLLSPLSRGDSPRWGTVALVGVSLFTGIGLSAAVYSFHRATSSSSIEWADDNQSQIRRRWLNVHAAISSLFLVLSLFLTIFFATLAPRLDACAHESCGADVSWSLISLVVAFVWIIVTLLGFRELYFKTLPANDDCGEVNKETVEEMT